MNRSLSSPVSDDAPRQVRVLHVDDEPGFTELTAEYLQRIDDRFEVTTATSPEVGLSHLQERDVDCVVSDFDMPTMNGLAFLDTIREIAPEMPFILFTGKGSEAIASEAISSGVTDYLQKAPGGEQYEILGNRIRNAVDQAWARTERQRHLDAIETAREGLAILDGDERYRYVNRAYARLHGTDPETLSGAPWEAAYDEAEREQLHPLLAAVRAADDAGETPRSQLLHGEESTREYSWARTGRGDVVCTVRDVTELHRNVAALERAHGRIEFVLENINAGIWEYDPETGAVTSSPDPCPVMGDGIDCAQDFFARIDSADRPHVQAAIEEATATGEPSSVEFHTTGAVEADWVRSSIDPIVEDGAVTLVAGFTYDITDQKRYERELQRTIERLEEFTDIVSHDLQSPLNVAMGRLELAREETDNEHLAAIGRALDRSQELVDNLLSIARDAGEPAVESVGIATVAAECERLVETMGGQLIVETDGFVEANPIRLHQLVENLVRNAVEHGGTGVTITIGDLEDGFYVEDDGPGVPESMRHRVFESGFSTKDDGSGLGLSIVADIAKNHGWALGVDDGVSGGARFEVSGVQSS